jgi:hypothetical protein
MFAGGTVEDEGSGEAVLDDGYRSTAVRTDQRRSLLVYPLNVL